MRSPSDDKFSTTDNAISRISSIRLCALCLCFLPTLAIGLNCVACVRGSRPIAESQGSCRDQWLEVYSAARMDREKEKLVYCSNGVDFSDNSGFKPPSPTEEPLLSKYYRYRSSSTATEYSRSYEDLISTAFDPIIGGWILETERRALAGEVQCWESEYGIKGDQSSMGTREGVLRKLVGAWWQVVGMGECSNYFPFCITSDAGVIASSHFPMSTLAPEMILHLSNGHGELGGLTLDNTYFTVYASSIATENTDITRENGGASPVGWRSFPILTQPSQNSGSCFRFEGGAQWMSLLGYVALSGNDVIVQEASFPAVKYAIQPEKVENSGGEDGIVSEINLQWFRSGEYTEGAKRYLPILLNGKKVGVPLVVVDAGGGRVRPSSHLISALAREVESYGLKPWVVYRGSGDGYGLILCPGVNSFQGDGIRH